MRMLKRTPLFLPILALMITLLSSPAVQADPPSGPIPHRVDVLMIGDRLVDVSYNLGVIPRYMSVRSWLWSTSKELKNASRIIGCPNFITNKNAKIVPELVKKHNITTIYLEKSKQFSRYAPNADPLRVADMVKNIPGVTVEIVDFTQGVIPAIQQLASLLNKTEEGQKLAKSYQTKMERAQSSLPKINKNILVLRGTYQGDTGKAFIQAEAPGGYTETYLLTPLGCRNVAKQLAGDKAKPRKGHYSLRSLENLGKANPDIIVLAGDTIAVQIALAKALKKTPALAQVPAIKNGRIYTLPLHNGSSVIEYPDILMQWSKILGG